MAKDIKKKFTITLDIGTGDAEKQLKSTAENIKKTLKSLSDGSNSLKHFNELSNMLVQIDAQMANLKATYGDGFEGLFNKISASVKNDFQSIFDFAHKKLAEFNADIQADKAHLDSLNVMMAEYKKASKVGEQAFKLEKITGFKGTKKEAQELYASFDKLAEAKKNFEASGDFTSEAYIKNYIKLMKTAAGLINADKLSENEGKDFGIDVEDLSKKAEQAKKIIKDMFGSTKANPAYSTNIWMKLDSDIKTAKHSLETWADALADVMSTDIKAMMNGTSGSGVDFSGMSKDIANETGKIVDAIEYGKKKVVDAWKKYYQATMDAKNQGYDIDFGETSPRMNTIKSAIDDMYDSWGAKTADGKDVKFKLDLSEYIADGDIGLDDIESEIDKLFKKHGVTLNIPLEEMLPKTTDLQGDLNKLGNAAQDASQKTASALTHVETKTKDVTESFQDLISYVSKSGSTPGVFFDKLESGAQSIDDELKNILESLSLIDGSGNVNLSSLKSGFTNKGGFVSDKYTMIARPDYYLGKIQSIQPKLQSAQQAGAQIGAIFDIIEDKAHGLIYEIQNTVPGESVLGHHSYATNEDILNATDAHIEGLIHTLQTLQQNGLFIDWGGDNILYDPQKGFSVIDLGDKGGKSHTVSTKNTMQENLDRFASEILKYDKGMGPKFQSMFVDRLYDMAAKMGEQVVNPNAAAAVKQQKNSQAASAQTAAAVKSEADAHEQNAAAINAENAALQAQIELKKKAQSMKWEAFALDDSTTGLKQAAGLQTLSEMEKFWKKANYEKQIDFHEITEAEAKKIFKAKLPKGLASSWYSSADFTAKDKLENEILADDELRNASLNYLYHLYDQMLSTYKDPSIKSFQDFLNAELTVYRGDKAPLIYDGQSKLSFSFKKNVAEGFDSNLGTAKIKPKDTIGNAGSGFSSEVETFISSELTSWFKQTGEKFADFYNAQTKEMQKEIDAGLVNFEKKRVDDILGGDLTKLAHQAGKSSYFKDNVLDKFNQGIIPDKLDAIGDGSQYDEFVNAYNALSEMQKKLLAYYSSLDAISASLPKQFSIHTKDGWGKSAVGKDAKLFNAVLNDPTGLQQHINNLTGEQKFNIVEQSVQAINAEAHSHQNNANAIQQEAKAQQDLNDLKQKYNDVQYELWDAAFNADGTKSSELSTLWSHIYDVGHTDDQDMIDKGSYFNKSFGDTLSAKDLFTMVESIEDKYGENLDYVKDYLKQVYANIDFDAALKSQDPGEILDVKDVQQKLYDIAKLAGHGVDPDKYHDMTAIINSLYDVKNADQDDIAKGKYQDDDENMLDAARLFAKVQEIETKYGENLDYVKNYLKQVFANVDFDSVSNIADLDDKDDLVKFGFKQDRPAQDNKQYTIADYENAYVAESSESQAAIDNLAVLHKRYEELYALTNTKPIDINFMGIPTPAEINEVVSALNIFKAKQQEILDLSLIDLDGNKDKIQELQAEVVGLQNQLSGAFLGDNASIEEYQAVYGLASKEDAMRLKNLIDEPGSYYSVLDDITNQSEQIMSKISESMREMIEEGDQDVVSQFMAQHAQLLKAQTAATDANVAASQQQLQVEQDITAEKQKQTAIEDQQDVQTATDVAQTQKVQTETAAMDELLLKINAVEQAVQAKTAAFEAEGVAVEEAANKEIAALTQLKTLLDNIQSALQVVFASNTLNLGDINLAQDKTSSNTLPNVLQGIKSTLEQIYGVLSKSTGVEADNKNSAKVKEPVVDNNVVDSDAYKLLAAKMPEDVSTETTLSAIKGAVDQLAKNSSDDEKSGEKSLDQLTASLLAATTELKSVANGIVQHKKASKSDTSVANARISDKASYAQIRDVALNSLGNKALESEVTEMKALANGIVQVTGWLKVAEDAWEGFTVQINEANEASKLAFSTNAKAAKQAAAQAKKIKKSSDDEDDLNIKKYNPEETKALAQQKIAKYTSEGKIATVQFKDSGRYTITILEKIGGLTKQIFQTFDENDQMIERTTATMSNNYLAKVQELQNFAQYGFDSKLLGDGIGETMYQDFKKASDELDAMNIAYSQAGNLSQDQIEQWKAQIKIVTQLGSQIQKLIIQNKNPAVDYKVNKTAYGSTPVNNAQADFNRLSSRAQPYSDGGWTDITAALEKYKNSLQELKTMQNTLASQPKVSDAQKTQFTELKKACSEYGKELKKLVDAADKFNAATDENTRMDVLGDINVDDRNSRADALQAYVQEVYGAQAAIGKFNGDMTELQFTIKNIDGTITNMTAAFNSAKTQIGSLHGETKKATTIFDELGNKFQELWRYAAARMGVDEVIQAVRKGVEYVREIDNALTDLKKVTNETDATYAQFLQTMSKTAGTVGSTVVDLTTMAGEWARLGYSLQEAGMLAESTAILLNVSEFDDATTASEALISTMQAFGYAADESQHVVDILNEVGNNYAVSSDGIATALQDSASALMEAGNSLEQATALVAAANKVVNLCHVIIVI